MNTGAYRQLKRTGRLGGPAARATAAGPAAAELGLGRHDKVANRRNDAAKHRSVK
jgi:hypothetical protein